MNKLALYGGTPAAAKPIHYGRQYIDEADCAAVREVLLSDYLTTGPAVASLEQRLCDLTGAKYAIAVANGTAALHAAVSAAGIGEGDEVITTPITFAASANCVLYCGGIPVFADIDSETYNISPASIREKVTSRTKAVIAVDFTGQPAQLDEIRQICKEHSLLLIEDAAHSIGSRFYGQAVGSIADMTTFSFHPVKTVTGGEGGAVLTNNKSLYDRLMLFRTHGITRNAKQMTQKGEGAWYYEQIELGYNYRLTDFQAALVTSQLNKLDRFAARRKKIVHRYDEAFADNPALTLQKEIQGADTVRHLYILQLNLENLNASRQQIYDAITAENIVPNVHYIPVYYHPYYQKLGYKKGICPVAERLYERILSIPLYYSLTDEDVESVVAAVENVTNYYGKWFKC